MEKDTQKDILQELESSEYKYGFVTDIETETIGRGLSEEVVRLISEKKGELALLLGDETYDLLRESTTNGLGLDIGYETIFVLTRFEFL